MKVKLENREYELKATGRFLLKYKEVFNENAMMALYKVAQDRDALECAKLIYCGINETMPFEEWLDSFESPLFILPVMDSVLEYMLRSTKPTVDNSTPSNGGEKKTN